MSRRTKGANLVTGYPAFTARMLARFLAAKGDKVYLLAQAKFEDSAGRFVRDVMAGSVKGAIEVLIGDVMNLDLGLSGRELRTVSREVERIHHMAAIYYLGVTSSVTERVNVEGTRNVLDVASDLDRLKRVVCYSTAFVAGDRTGVILEEELDEGQHFRNAYERTKYEAELLARSYMKDVPISVVRPSVIVGDSRTGEIDRLDGPYYLVRTIVNLPVDVALPLPGGGAYPLNLVPVDFVVAAADAVSRDPWAEGKTFHLTDPNPLPAHKVFDLVADLAGRKRPRGSIPSMAWRTIFRLPGMDRLLRPQRHFLEYISSLTIYNCMNTLRVLAGTGITCPPVPDYLGSLVDFVQKQSRKRGRKTGEHAPGIEEDALDAFF